MRNRYTTVGVLAIVGVIVLITSALAPAGALENLPNPPRNAGPGYDNGPWGPPVWTIGDSISASADQKNYIAWFNGGNGWHTHIEATGGTNLIEHWRSSGGWNTFVRAAQSNARVIVVELGTNDIGGITSSTPNPLAEIAKVFDYMTWTAAYLNGTGKCVVWAGLNEWGNVSVYGVYDQADVARAFDNKLRELTRTYPAVHYADYTSLINTNATFRAGLYNGQPDTIHPKTADSMIQLAAWYTTQVRSSCGI